MGIKNFLFVIVFISAIGFFLFNVKRIVSYILLGQKENRFDNPFVRLSNVLKIAFAQSKLLREPVAGISHFFIFWGFVLFLLAVVESIIQGFYSPFSFHFLGPIYSAITFIQDFFGLFVIISVFIALYRRLVKKVKRLDIGKKGNLEAAFILFLILGVVVSMYGQNILNIVNSNFVIPQYEVRPISAYLSNLLFYGSSYKSDFLFEFFWWTHVIIVFSFLNFLPYSKHFHVLSSIPNVFFAKIGKEKYSVKKINLEDENATQFGAADFEHLSWKQVLDGFACTECGRCTSVCPAANTGKTLSPRKIIIDIRHRAEMKAPLMLKGVKEDPILNQSLVHNFISDSELWACTTCNACVYECPVSIEHIDSIVEMRRNLVLMESSFPGELNAVFKNIENNFSPWAFNPQDRANWAEGMNVKTIAQDPNGEILFWVGCAGSFDARYQKVTKSIAKLMQIANIDFRILGVEEKCNGDTARRLGNEYLAQTLMQENTEILNSYGVKKIVTGCPHCYNSLKNEFPQFGGNYEVIHHSELILQLIKEGKLKLNDIGENSKITFHDSCYLGRYNNIYAEPRNLLNMIKGNELVEMERKMDKGFCCGAGGGRMFLEETEGTRININRTEEALNTGADTIASACPFCMTMMTDGIKSFEKSEEVLVKDIAEIVLENININ